MLVFNCTNRHLTGSERRTLRREWVRRCRQHRALLIAVYGLEKGGEMATRIRRDQERELIQEETDGVYLLANAVWAGPRRGYLDGVTWKKGGRGEWMRTKSVVKI